MTFDQATLTEGGVRQHRPTFATLIGWLVGVLAACVMLGWLVRVPWMVQIFPGSVAMVFSSALSLLLLAIALILTTSQWRWSKPVQQAIGIVVLLLGVTVLVQYRFDLALPIDLPGIHIWLNHNSGRMAPNTALAYALAGLTVLLLVQARSGWRALPALLGAFAVAMFGVTGLIAYQLRPELMYGWHVATRMSLHTGVALVLLGIGFAAVIYRTHQLSTLFRLREDLRVGLLGGGLMVFVGVVGALAAFSMMQGQLLTALQDGLKLSFHSRHDLMVAEIQSSIQSTRDFAHRPGIERELGRLRADPKNRTALSYVESALERHVSDGPTSSRVFDDRGRIVASFGSALGEKLELPLRQPRDAALLWTGKIVGLRVAQDIQLRGRRVGRIESTYALPGITRMRDVALGFGATGDMVICVQAEDGIRCLPTTLTPHHAEVQPATEGGPTLMERALAGERSAGIAIDYRGEWVIAAYGPVGELGLGLVLKVDVAEVYAPIRKRFEYTLLLVAIIVGIGILLMRARMVPLVRRLTLSEKRFRGLLESAPDAMLVSDLDGRIVWANPQAEQLFGYTRAELIKQPIEVLIPEGAREAYVTRRNGYALTPESRDMSAALELSGRRKDGSEFPVEIRLNPQETEDGVQIISTVRDISERMRAVQALRESEQRWQFALDGARDGVWDWNLVTSEVYFSRQWKQMLGYEEHEITGSLEEWDKRVHPDDKARTHADIEKHMKGETPYYQNEHRMLCKDGSYKWILDRGMVVGRDAQGKPTRMIGTHTDMTERKRTEETIRELSLVDELTGLRNRRGFLVLGEAQLSLARRLGRKVVLYFADVDGLKQINDTLGHEEGDHAIVDVANMLRTTYREADLIARLGGDEFVVLALEAPNVDTSMVLGRIERYLADFNRDAQRPYRLAVSVGVAQHGADAVESLTELLGRADAGMYQIKQKRRTSR